ncbi:DUF2637 domain-containing protein [Microbispora corallina]|uniref:DUF2637 domain-containing protein n=1 Tax=Microbispora corallina TaxID=83302 RepID=UPI0019509D98|nr:DUF2637 domain-containing protein [Microbispora corallina]
MLRRLAIGLAGLALAVLAGAACALSFDDLRALAITGRAEPRLAYLYPTAFDVLLVVALVSVPLLRGGRFLVRLQAGFVLVLLLVAAGAATVVTASNITFDPQQSAVAVALLPWVMLVVGLWLLLILLKHTRASRADLDGEADGDDLVPFTRDREPRARDAHRPTAAENLPAPVVPVPEAVAPRDYVPPPPVSPVAETVAPPEYAPPLPVHPEPGTSQTSAGAPTEPHPARRSAAEAAPRASGEPPYEIEEALALVPVTAAPATPPVDEIPAPPEADESAGEPVRQAGTAASARHPEAELSATSSSDREPEPAGEATPPDAAVPDDAPAGEPQPAAPKRNRPVRWGDLVRTHAGDVLVHPKPTPSAPPEQAAESPPAEQVLEETADQAAEETGEQAADQGAGQAGAGEPGRSDAAAAPETAPPAGFGAADDPHAADDAAEQAGNGGSADEPDALDETDVDTQPLRQIRDAPDPAHAWEVADPEEQNRTRRMPYESGEGEADGEEGQVPLAPPSGRMRSTPRPPA